MYRLVLGDFQASCKSESDFTYKTYKTYTGPRSSADATCKRELSVFTEIFAGLKILSPNYGLFLQKSYKMYR